MLTIIKRNGEEQPYMPEKIRTVLAAISDEIGQPLTEGDLEVLLSDMNHLLREKSKATSRDLFMMVAGALYTRGYFDIVNAYRGHSSNAWR